MTERSVFLAALDIDDPAARSAYLDETCAAAPDLRVRVEDLLAAHARSASFMGRPAPDRDQPGSTAGFTAPGPALSAAFESATLLAGRYQLFEPIGEGGMGTVYRAEQVQPVKRTVAVKLIKPGMDSRAVLSRFEVERQALALMSHPNIAKVLEAGTTPDGRPFFVMELVNGVPLTDYCDTHRLPVADRLELFRQVCQAIQHAHQKGIIHRDLKPSNILVETPDGKPVPKVIDFGLAKAVGGVNLTEQTLFTSPGSVIGTPLYMAPEQAGPNAQDVDTRVDVYALGAVLYELLTGSTPIRRDTLKKAALDEILRVIREEDPPPPSSRLGTSEILPSVAASRGTEPARLGRFVRGDLDWVVMKSLEKNRDRRYDSAAAFADDVERFLNHEPVTAGPPTAVYRMRKFVRRNRAAVTAAGLVLLALVGGVVGTTLGLVEADAARAGEADRAEGERRAKLDAQAATRSAVGRLDQLDKSNAILEAIFVDLDPLLVEGDGTSLRLLLAGRLEAAGRQLSGEAVGDPGTVARMQNNLGLTLASLGEASKAVPLLDRAVATATARSGDDDPLTLGYRHNLAVVYAAAGRLDLAVPLLERTLAARAAKHGDGSEPADESRGHLAKLYVDIDRLDLAVPLFERVRQDAETRFGEDDPKTLRAATDLGEAYRSAGRVDRAVPLHERTLAELEDLYGVGDPRTLPACKGLAAAYYSKGEYARAIPLMERVAAAAEARLGPDHRNSLQAFGNLGTAHCKAGRPDLARPLHERVLATSVAKLGDDHQDTLTARNNLGLTYTALGRADLAIPLFEWALADLVAKLGDDHANTMVTRANLADAYRSVGRPDQAIPLYDRYVRLAEVRYGKDDGRMVNNLSNLAGSYLEAGRTAEAVPVIDRYLAVARRVTGAGSAEVADLLLTLAPPTLKGRQFAAAERYAREYLTIREKDRPDAWETFLVRSVLGGSLLGQGKLAEAEPFIREGYEGMNARVTTKSAADRRHLAVAVNRLIELSVALGRPDEAAKWRAERTKYPPEQAPPPRVKK